ncbi:MAG: hypothetical protein LBH41_00380 [Rickettsiales bacterium]|jgi:NTP pyrophosphatase (non-canonical NTP hydrolase)|nr:hypothetical protein [Rickettsiales bacterium]
MTVAELQEYIVETRAKIGFSTDIVDSAIGLSLEAGEVLNAVRKQFIRGLPPVPSEDKSSLPHELADVAFYLFALAARLGVDIEDAVKSKAALNLRRFLSSK